MVYTLEELQRELVNIEPKKVTLENTCVLSQAAENIFRLTQVLDEFDKYEAGQLNEIGFTVSVKDILRKVKR